MRSRLIFLALCSVALLLRVYQLAAGPINLDEGYTLLAARNGFLTSFFNHPCDWNPPAASMPYSLWLSLFGSGRFAVEMLSIFFGVASLVAAYLLAEKLFSSEVAIKFLFLGTISQYHLLFSQFIRVYSFALFVTTLAALLLVQHWRAARSSTAVSFIVVSFAAMNLHYYAALVILSLLSGIFIAGDRRIRRFAFLSGALLGLLYIPTIAWQADVIDRARRQSWIDPADLQTAASIWYHFSSQSVVLLIVYASLLVFAARQCVTSSGTRTQTLLLLLWLFTPMALAGVFSLTGGSVLHVRYFIFCLMPFLILVANGWELLPSRGLRVLLGCLIGVTSAFSIYRYAKEAEALEQDSEIYRRIAAEYRNGDAIVHTTKCSFVSSVYAHDFQFAEYIEKTHSSWVLSCTLGNPPEKNLLQSGDVTRLWIVESDCPPHRAKEAPLGFLGFAAAGKYSFSNGRLSLFERAPGISPNAEGRLNVISFPPASN